MGVSELCLSCCIHALLQWQWGHLWGVMPPLCAVLWAGQWSGVGPWCSHLAASPAGEVILGFCPRFLPQSSLCLFVSGRGGRGTVALRVCACPPGSSSPAVTLWAGLDPTDGGQHPTPFSSIPSHPIPSRRLLLCQHRGSGTSPSAGCHWLCQALAGPPWPVCPVCLVCPVCPQRLPGLCQLC